MDIKISSLRRTKAILGWIFLLSIVAFFIAMCRDAVASSGMADNTEMAFMLSKLFGMFSLVGFFFTALLIRVRENKKISWNILYLLLVETLNRFVTNKICAATTPRPRAYSLWSHIPKPASKDGLTQGPVSDYTAWPSLTDKSFSTRHLPPVSAKFIDGLPKVKPSPDKQPPVSSLGDITKLFIRKGEMTKDRSTTLFMFFAQWFTDSVLRVDPNDRRKNTSNHNIDLCQIYGLKESTATILRSGSDGKLRSKIVKGEEFLDNLGSVGSNKKWEVKEIYKDLPYVKNGFIYNVIEPWKGREENFYATGLERGNSSIGYVAISTLFLREHNRICTKLKALNEKWDDERFFQTARNINIVLLMKLLIVDYINHIFGSKLFIFDRSFAERQQWYRTPWISIEFDMLYRWHGLIPDTITIDGTLYDHTLYRFNNILLEAKGLNKIITASSQNSAGKISLQNVPSFMAGAESSMIQMGRDFRLASYNDYREHFGLKKINSFEKLTNNKKLSNELKGLYDDDISKLDLIVGLFAEKSNENKLYGKLMYTMVAYDAFTQIYTNPLLASNVYNKDTFTQFGLDLIDDTNSIQDLVDRNNQTGGKAEAYFENKKT